MWTIFLVSLTLIVLLVFTWFELSYKLRSFFVARKPKAGQPLNIAFLHPDLGIGGAEKLVVEAAVGLQKKGHRVKIFTSFHDEKHSFPETNDGTLAVEVAGNWLPVHTKGLFQLPKALLRYAGRAMFSALPFRFVFVTLAALDQHKKTPYDVFIVDQIPATIPLLEYSGAKILFYCHFPDKLLAKRDSILKKIYRYPFDRLEEFTLRRSDLSLVNSQFTLKIFQDNFPTISVLPKILYPCVNVDSNSLLDSQQTNDNSSSGTITLLSLNRYERKKNIELAIDTFVCVSEWLLERAKDDIGNRGSKSGNAIPRLELVIVGGYSTLVKENVDYHLDKCKKLGIEQCVTFLFSISDAERNELLRKSLCLLYTPAGEHFGICPLEAALQGTPVVACDSGGPLESIQDGVTGFNRPPEPRAWAACVQSLIADPKKARRMGLAARDRVKKQFSSEAQADQLEAHIWSMFNEKANEVKKSM